MTSEDDDRRADLEATVYAQSLLFVALFTHMRATGSLTRAETKAIFDGAKQGLAGSAPTDPLAGRAAFILTALWKNLDLAYGLAEASQRSDQGPE